MNSCFSSIVKQKIINRLSDDLIADSKKLDQYYNHFTMKVSTLSEYIDIVTKLATISKKSNYGCLVFRGHSDYSSKYKLIPTIARTSKGTEEIEGSMVNEMLILRPEEFEGINSDFDLLAKLQHFGLPTRLLDFTYNPLIALYFACSSKSENDSRVVCTYDTSDTSTEDLVEKICGMYRFYDYKAISLDNLIGNISHLRKYHLQTRELLMAKPKYSNERIKHQAAVFMIFPNEINDLRSRMVVCGKANGDEGQYKFFSYKEKEIERLKCIREEPPNIYDNTFKLNWDSFDKLLKYYTEKFIDFNSNNGITINPKYSYIFTDRFSIGRNIQTIDEKRLSESFISIIIDKKHRKKIIDDLSTIGIDKAFVFPELEYTAETIKNKYI